MAAGLRYPAPIPVLALSGFTFVPPAATPGYRSMFFRWLGGNVGGSGTTPPATDANPRMWHVRGGFGRHSIAGQRGYSK